ncbi:MAG TPA: hypothetical protein PKK06_13885 [Phycisphaerae bacterium]|nr:hypothetical protein [Phycisphaerae bacterium]HNU46262.1 hypothetical protein [Phycisphaerae bacterium]
MAAQRVIVAVAVLTGLLGGCAGPRPQPWAPAPQVHWEELAGTAVPAAEDGYVILSPEPTQGRFPAAIGVSRVGVEIVNAETAERRPYLCPRPRNEFLSWNSAFDDQMAVSEVFPVWQRDLGGAEATPGQIVAAFRALGAKVGLIYAQNAPSETEAEMLGVIYDTDTTTPLATVHARAHSVPPRERPRGPRHAIPWETDARALVRVEFQNEVARCLRELLKRDVPQTVDVPAGWVMPETPRWIQWPPQ